MRLVTFDSGEGPRVGAVVDGNVLDLARQAQASGGGSLPATMLDLIQAGDAAWNRAREVVASASGSTSAASRPLGEVKLLAPIPRPSKNVFCLGVNYAAHLNQQALGGQIQKGTYCVQVVDVGYVSTTTPTTYTLRVSYP